MSKSLGNTILLSDTAEEVNQRLRKAVTDPEKVRKNDPGRPDVCLVYTYHQKFNPTETDDIRQGCESGALGCVDCKRRVGEKINIELEPLRERRVKYEQTPSIVTDILADGERRANEAANATMTAVREAMKLG